MLTAAWYINIHHRLLSEDPTAPAELVEALLQQLIQRLTHKYPKLEDSGLISDAVVDTLVSYIKNPVQFHEKKRGLFGYLLMSAEGDLKNALAKRKRVKRKEISLDDVEVEPISGNKPIDESHPQLIVSEKMRQQLHQIFKNDRDRKLVRLILDGARSTADFVEVLELQNISIEEQRREVKRHKDRIILRLKRYGKKLREKDR